MFYIISLGIWIYWFGFIFYSLKKGKLWWGNILCPWIYLEKSPLLYCIGIGFHIFGLLFITAMIAGQFFHFHIILHGFRVC